MKKFEIKCNGKGKWLVLHNEVPKFNCVFEDKKYNYHRTITGLTDPTGDPKEVQLLQKMEHLLKRYHKDKIDG